jgi:hypothetical protein
MKTYAEPPPVSGLLWSEKFMDFVAVDGFSQIPFLKRQAKQHQG